MLDKQENIYNTVINLSDFIFLNFIDMKKVKNYLKNTKSFFSKLYTRFTNYKNTKKWFVLYLVILTFCLFFFPIIDANWSKSRFLFSSMLWKSSLVILIAIIGLFLWNLSVSFKTWITKLCSLREDEPLVDFLLLWIIVSVFMWVMDGANIAISSWVTQKIWLLNGQVAIDGLLLLWWLIWSFITLWKTSQKATKRTKILNIVEENHGKRWSTNKSGQVTHLFDDLDNEN